MNASWRQECFWLRSILTQRFLLLCLQVQSRRDSEIVRVKKQYLKLYVSENRVAPKRSLDGGDEQVQTPRRKYRRASVEVWKEVCLSTGNSYDQVLPSLEEASQLFGFSD